uniref:Telomeric repeat-binding factor 2-interacting protein 1 n=2 Tax=Pyxicephalus adspersus TaxID=30357 RepID=A0AAV3AF81_PYXAD|nr:TPA: hypothetical protein GDO54_006052 [Pyxicephalus adspersus]
MIPSVSAIQRCDPMIPSASGTEKCDPVLPSSSADAHQSCSVTQQGALTSANTPGTNISSKKQSILTPRKRSTNATLNESSLQGNKNLSSSHSAETVPSNGEDSDDWKDLHIFERANMEFEEAHDDINSEQPAQAVSQTEDNNGESPMDETPSTSQASESNGLREAMMDLMKEFDLDISRVTQALFFNSGELVSTRHFLRTGTRPDHYPIWEPKDDLDLKNNPKMKSQLIKKYGAYNVTRRVAFLAS